MAKASLEELNQLHGRLADYLSAQLQAGEVPPAVLGHIIKFLKDNEVTADLLESKPMNNLIQEFLNNQDDYDATLLREEFGM